MVVAHRGASFDVAEHTLGAYLAAIESGVDALECDVRLTRDGHLVCVHDRTVNRTSDGRGVVSDLDLEGLQALNFSSWRGDLPGSADQLLTDSPYLEGVAPDRVTAEGGVLTLEMLLGLVHDSATAVRLLIETKHPTRYSGLVEKELVDMLARFGWAGRPPTTPSLRHPADLGNRVIVMSFAPTALRRVKLQAPEIPTVLLLDRLFPVRREGMLPAGVPIAGPGLHVLRADPDYVARAHARGHRVFVWTVDSSADIRFVLDLGVDTVITNRPKQVLALLG
ncbi:MAG: glycerophosphoryl diester phosphodiesterase [Pseudonocardiales bacterium]|jgi:glycerophosphoryl diester phosphodiesterase|nr:glycerophosphoryl diester phosphodiesterase [Pseudonocardiales bacterium]